MTLALIMVWWRSKAKNPIPEAKKIAILYTSSEANSEIQANEAKAAAEAVAAKEDATQEEVDAAVEALNAATAALAVKPEPTPTPTPTPDPDPEPAPTTPPDSSSEPATLDPVYNTGKGYYNPNTADNINEYLVVLVVAAIGAAISGAMVFKSVRSKKKK